MADNRLRVTAPATKARRSEMRSAGHYWGGKAADAVIAEGEPFLLAAIEQRLQQVIAEREAALREIGADDVRAWTGACDKRVRLNGCAREGG